MSSLQTKHIVIIAGETSGDIHASLLVKELLKLDPGLAFSGLGGPSMQAAGVHIQEDLTRIAVVGFAEVLKNFARFKAIFDAILNKIETSRPAAVILVDYPGFNLRLAREIKKRNIPTKIIYYISPQVWAWKESRVNLIRQVVDRMIVLFAFELHFYRKHGINVEFVGHPLLDHIRVTRPKEQMLAAVGWEANRLTIGILPGSRQKEVEKILGGMLDAAKIISTRHRAVQFLLLKAPAIRQEQLIPFLERYDLPLKTVEHSYDYHAACDLCLVASGTATLETAILQKPMVVVYKTSFLTWALAKLLIKIPYIGLVNVVAGKKIVPECIQFDATGKKIAAEITAIYTDELKLAEIHLGLKRVREILGGPGATKRAAEIISSLING